MLANVTLLDILQEYFNKGQVRDATRVSTPVVHADLPDRRTLNASSRLGTPPPIVVPDPEFDFAKLMKQRMEEEDQLAKLDAYDPFDSHSLLSTPHVPRIRSKLPTLLSLPAELSSLPLPADPLGPRAQLPSGLGSQRHAKEQSKANRRRKRKREREEMTALDYEPCPTDMCQTHVRAQGYSNILQNPQRATHLHSLPGDP